MITENSNFSTITNMIVIILDATSISDANRILTDRHTILINEIVSAMKTHLFLYTVKNDLLKIRKNLLTPTSAKMLLFQDVFLLIY